MTADDIDERAALAQLLRQGGFTVPEGDALARRPDGHDGPVGAPQQRLWVQSRMAERPDLNTLRCLARFDRPLDEAALDAAATALAARHEALRTRFEDTPDGLRERVDVAPPRLGLLDGNPDDGDLLRTPALQGFDLARGPLWRLYRFADPAAADTVVLICHHAILDLAGARCLFDDLDALLRGVTLAPVLQQADVAWWRSTRQARRDADSAYWPERLAGAPPDLRLAAAPRPAVVADDYSPVPLPLDAALAAAVRGFAASRGTTPFFVFLAAYATALSRFAASDDICIGTTVANRAVAGAEHIVGCLSDLITLRCDLGGSPGFAALTERLQRTCGADLDHTALGFSEVVDIVRPPRRLGVPPLFQALFNLLPVSRPTDGTGVTLSPLAATAARADLSLELEDDGGAFSGRLEARVGQFAPTVAKAIAEAIIAVVRHGIARPDHPVARLPLQEPAAAAALLDRLNPPRPEAPPETLVDLMDDRARRTPDAVALRHDGLTITFGEVATRSRTLAEALVATGLPPGAPVAVHLDRSFDLAVAAMAAMRAGGAALLLAPSHPSSRLIAILADSGAPILISRDRPAWLDEVPTCRVLPPDAAPPVPAPPLPRPGPGDVAYVVYTSGSSGRPKGVNGLHRGMVNRLRAGERLLPFAKDDVALLKTTPSFVDVLAELFGPFIAGVPSVIADDATAQDPEALTKLIAAEGITRIVLVPSLLRAWLDTLPDLGRRLASLRLCVTSGEILPGSLAGRFQATVAGCTLVNLYGSSEISADATWHVVGAADGDRVPIGSPLPGNRIAVTDADGQSLPVGVPGEIAVAGLGVAGGYRGDSALTADRFRADLPALPGAGPAFLTGDCGFWDEAGRLVYLGRLDRQVKVQGVRVEPGEVEAAIEAHPGVRACHVTDAPAAGGGTVLVAYVVGEATVTDLRPFLAMRLPRALMPSAFVVLDALPLGPSGKIDRFALPPAIPTEDTPSGPARRRLDAREALVATVWSAVLGRTVEAATADFFLMGGGSLQAIVAATRLSEALGRPVPPVLIFETPVLENFVRRLDADVTETLPLPQRHAGPAEGAAPATSNQRWLWQIWRQNPGGTAYNLSMAYRVRGRLDIAALDRALCALLHRHAALRTCLGSDDGDALVQIVAPVPDSVLQQVEAPVGARTAFALDRDLPFRAELQALAPDDHVLTLTVHHVASDGWSGRVLIDDLAALYRPDEPTPPALPPPALQLADVGRWQQAIRPLLAQRLEGYRDSLAGAVSPRLPGLRPPVPGGSPVATLPIPLSKEALARFDALGRTLQASRFIMVLAAWALLLARFSDAPRPLIGFPQAGRNVPGLNDVVGYLANTVLMAPDIAEADSFAEVVAATRRGLLAALHYQDVPLAWVQATGCGWPDESDPEALRAMVIPEDATGWDLRLAGVATALVDLPASPQARVDLALLVSETADGPDVRRDLRIEYATTRIDAALAGRLADGLACLIEAATSDPATPPGRLPLVTTTSFAAAVAVAPAGPAPVADRLEAILEASVSADPTAAAVSDLDHAVSRATLRDHAAAIATRLIALGVEPGDRVGLLAPPSPRQVAGLIGIWQAGATVVSLDPAHPRERLDWTLEDAGIRVLLGDSPIDHPCPQASLDPALREASPPPAARGAAPAAIVYTSGTSGRPKGVPVAHDALCRLGAALADAYGARAGDRVLQVVSPSFDVALSDLALALTAGAVLVAPPRAAVLPGRCLAETLAGARITHLQAPASMLAATTPGPLPDLRLVAVGGEVCPPATLRQWAAGRRLVIAYGPTETTVTATLAPFVEERAAPGTIGRPFCGASLGVVDDAGAPLPIGVAGELVIGGLGVAAGYLNQPDLTAERFVADPAGPFGARRYRTGDRVRMEDDGSFTFLGRLDRQVKLRGFRIEPAEIEAVLAAQPGVARALVALRDVDGAGDGRLVAWVVAAPPATPDIDALRQAVRQALPEHMVPAAVAVLAEVPLTANGKVDWDALPTPTPAPAAAPHQPAQPLAQRAPSLTDETAIRRYLTALWSELLPGFPRIGLDQSFFDIGGHSLLVVRMHERLEDAFALSVPVGEMFANPTIRTMAAMLHARRPAAVPPAPEIEEFLL